MKVNFLLFLIYFFFTAYNASANALNEERTDTLQQNYYQKILGTTPDENSRLRLWDKIIEWLGTPYRYGGKSKKGIDCSGFVSKIYKSAFQINLLGSSSNIFTQVKKVEKGNLQEGDILFFKIRNDKISHVGIYLKDNKFAHASSSRGIVINDLRENYYQKRFFTAGRHVIVNSFQALELLNSKPYQF